MRPLERGMQRSYARRPRWIRADVVTRQRFCDDRQRQHASSAAASCTPSAEPPRERQTAITLPALRSSKTKASRGCARPGVEERHSSVPQRLGGRAELRRNFEPAKQIHALAGQLQRCLAGDEQAHARSRGMHCGDQGGGAAENVLGVVHDQQKVLVAQRRGHPVGRAAADRQVERARGGGGHIAIGDDVSQFHPNAAVPMSSRALPLQVPREQGLAASAGTGDRDQWRRFHQGTHRCQIELAAGDRRRCHHLAGVERCARRRAFDSRDGLVAAPGHRSNSVRAE